MHMLYRALALISFVLCSCATHKNMAAPQDETPKLLKPVVKKVWIPPEIRNGGAEWVDGHFVYKIDQETKWSR